ncbi:cysteate racemase [Paramaledivibacter caminithermalis]|uniref:Aspartate racemase n=1 Tax=Paramaledivibacter caminithermalis (strain DSM 15212 / CIP 107654 / DViRD3) TaxID=1121301 RepID=A0A1M6SZY2_PARC5|nr:amino acid racemase [Paramaledivibacter caminithermalis]SHK50302.1 aspartate racemase [Paramaledivibacter caminithermalis DSM 15212]
MKTIGILGGMGPLATADLFKKIVTLTEANSDNEHIPILIDNNTQIPDRTDYIINNSQDPIKEMIRSAIKLEMMGADVIIMPCNTAHYFYDEIVKYVNIPFINMIEETAKEIKKLYSNKKVALLATEGTYKAGIYDKVFDKYGLELVKPSSQKQKHVTELIYDIKRGKSVIDLTSFQAVLRELKEQGVEAFILGCTEIPVAFQMFNIDEKYIDPTKILACSAIRYVGKNIKNV